MAPAGRKGDKKKPGQPEYITVFNDEIDETAAAWHEEEESDSLVTRLDSMFLC